MTILINYWKLKGKHQKSIFISITFLSASLSFLAALLLLHPPPPCPPFLVTPSLQNIVGGVREDSTGKGWSRRKVRKVRTIVIEKEENLQKIDFPTLRILIYDGLSISL
jgi:hypothetical protein